jgi:hypothetical protein
MNARRLLDPLILEIGPYTFEHIPISTSLSKGKAVPLHAMEALRGRDSSYSFSILALDGGEWSASRPGRAFTPGERTPGTHCTGGWEGPIAGLDTEVREKKSFAPAGNRTPVVQPVVRHCTAWANPAPYSVYTTLISNPFSNKITAFICR